MMVVPARMHKSRMLIILSHHYVSPWLYRTFPKVIIFSWYGWPWATEVIVGVRKQYKLQWPQSTIVLFSAPIYSLLRTHLSSSPHPFVLWGHRNKHVFTTFKRNENTIFRNIDKMLSHIYSMCPRKI